MNHRTVTVGPARPRVSFEVIGSLPVHGILDGPFQEQSKHPQEPMLPPSLQKSVTTAFLSLSLQSQDPATPGSPCPKPRCWLVLDWTLIHYKSIVTGSPLVLLRLKKKRGSPDITHPHRSFCIAVRPSIASSFQVRPYSYVLGKGRVKRRQPIFLSRVSISDPTPRKFTPNHRYFCSQRLSFFQL
jgi:hypothetical protein